jgi:hypothetical protein
MMPELVVDVNVSIRGHELVQAIYALILNDEDFQSADWTVDDAEVLMAAGRKILAGFRGGEMVDG